MSYNIVVAIDGPSGSGKSTVAGMLAKRLGFVHLSSGALYRALALFASRRGRVFQDEAGLVRLLGELDFQWSLDSEGNTQFLVNGENVQGELLSDDVGRGASLVAVLPQVRQYLNGVQHLAAHEHNLVLEGRDSGTVVFPETPFKFYLEASAKERAARRWKQLVASGQTTSDVAVIERDIMERDYRDSTRCIAPLSLAADAVVVDTTELSAAEVVEKIWSYVDRQISELRH